MAKKKTTRRKTKGACAEVVAVCRNPGCRWRFDKTDRASKCRKCGEKRACGRETEGSQRRCSVHGGKRPDVDGFKLVPPLHLAKIWNRVLSSPGLMSMAENQALFEARLQELNRMIEIADSRAAHEEILEAVNAMEAAVSLVIAGEGRTLDLLKITRRLRRAIEPVNIEASLWHEAVQVQETIRRTNETERKWTVAEQDCFPIEEVVEMLKVHARLSLKYITAPQDRSNYAADFRTVTPRMAQD